MLTNYQARYRSGLNGAPVVGGSATFTGGLVKNFLSYCMQAVGWTLVADSTYTAVLKNGKGTTFLRIQNDGNFPYNSALMNSSSVVVSVGNSYTSINNQLGGNKNFYLATTDYLLLNNSGPSAGNTCVFYGNENGFYIGFLANTQTGDSDSPYFQNIYFFGDIVPFDSVNSSPNVSQVFSNLPQNNFMVIAGEDKDNRIDIMTVQTQTQYIYNQIGYNYQTDSRQIQGWHRGGIFPVLPNQTVFGYQGLTYPNYLGKIDIDKLILGDNGQRRGYLAGARGTLQDLPFGLFDTFSTYNAGVARDFEYIKTSRTNGLLIEVSNTWYN